MQDEIKTPEKPSRPKRRQTPPPRFVTGSLLRHILVMTGTGALGLVAIFVGDLANIYFLSLLPEREALVAAVGYASTILMLTIGMGIGLSIAAISLVSPALGAGHNVRARRLTTSAHMWTLTISCVLTVIVWFSSPLLLDLLGATGRTKELANIYLAIVVPALPPLALGMTAAGVLRSAGDARRAMNITLFGAIANIILDPILIFGFDLGIVGAAWASVTARIIMMAIGLYGVIHVHQMMGRPKLRTFLADGRPLAAVAIPAVATNLSTPAANAYVTAVISQHGDSAVAGWTIIGRILPVAFGVVFALSGVIGPIIGQNYGARSKERMHETLRLSLFVTAAFTAAAWVLLALLAPVIVAQFRAEGQAADLILLFCRWLAPLFFFLGALFISNAAFNTLGRAHISTTLNWARATLGTIPFVLIGEAWAGAEGVVAGQMMGGLIFGGIGVALCWWLIEAIGDSSVPPPPAKGRMGSAVNGFLGIKPPKQGAENSLEPQKP
ncbi:MAG: MATE family efflux transporter [Alphaproteobacteria bacterium]|nr:MATE family efflux transporter [Alphaproteobacteria bacterium]